MMMLIPILGMTAFQIPSDVIVEILVCLPVKTLLRFKSVCKDWYALINSPIFIQLHLSKSHVSNSRRNLALFYSQPDCLSIIDDIYCPLKPINLYWPRYTRRIPDYVFTVGSCNGLVCLCVTVRMKVSCFLICNPSTRTFKFKKNLPFSEMKCLTICKLSFGFGYDSEHDDYKIVVTRRVRKESIRDVYIYSFKAGLWKCVILAPAQGSSGSFCQNLHGNAVFANNMLHYIVSTTMNVVQESNYPKNYRIARLDLSSETRRNDLSFPVAAINSCTDFMSPMYGVLDGSLYVRIRDQKGSHNVWILKRYGDEDSWSIKYNIPERFNHSDLAALSKEGSRLLLFSEIYYSTHFLWWYDSQHDTTEAFTVEASEDEWDTDSTLHLCIASLVSIPGALPMTEQLQDDCYEYMIHLFDEGD